MTNISIRTYSTEELSRYPKHFSNRYHIAKSLIEASSELQSDLKIGEVDGTDILVALAAGQLEGTAEVINSTSQAGIFTTVRRISADLRQRDSRWFIARYTYLNHFGFHGRSVFVPAMATGGRISFFPSELFNPKFVEAFRDVYMQSPRCREEDVDEHLRCLRGLYLLERLSIYKPQPREVAADERVYKGHSYAADLANLYKKDPELLHDALITDMKRADVAYLKPLGFAVDDIKDRIVAQGGRDMIVNLWNVIMKIYEDSKPQPGFA